jgi:hypothetical protein
LWSGSGGRGDPDAQRSRARYFHRCGRCWQQYGGYGGVEDGPLAPCEPQGWHRGSSQSAPVKKAPVAGKFRQSDIRILGSDTAIDTAQLHELIQVLTGKVLGSADVLKGLKRACKMFAESAHRLEDGPENFFEPRTCIYGVPAVQNLIGSACGRSRNSALPRFL